MLTAGAAVLVTALGLVGPPVAAAETGQSPDALSENTVRQIEALQSIKKSQNSGESKVDSRLLVEQKLRAQRMSASAVPALGSGANVSAAGTVLVDIRGQVSEELLKGLRESGAGIRAVSQRYGSVRAEVPLNAVLAIAGRADVKKVEAANEAFTARQLAEPAVAGKRESKQEKADRIAAELKKAVEAKGQAGIAAGPINSEGDRAHNADTARQQFGVTGVGTKICALSDGIDSLATSQARGELPAGVDVIPGQEGDGDEGTAMLEIIHDLAPNASLGFASAFNSDASFADNIRKLRFDAHCDVIVDDVLYFKESPFQDWIIAQAVNDVTANGALYFSSAGNEGNVADGTSGHWEGDFVDSGKSVGKFAGTAHNFAGAAGNQIFEPISNSSGAVPVTLFWSDPLGRSNNDYDLYLLNAAGNVVDFSQDNQTGTQDAYERVDTTGAAGLRLAIVKFSGEGRYLSLSALRGRFTDSADGLKAYTSPGVTVGHSAARDAFSVAAAPAAKAFPRALEPGDPANPAGPFPGAFGAATKVERFTSDGPRRVFYQADGTPITPGNVSGTGGEVRAKPDITAADGVSTSVTGFTTFYGTSAAAPHAAAIAGLVLSGNPGLPPADVREALITTAVDILSPGRDNSSGAGVILADKVLAYTGASPQPLATAGRPTVTPADGGSALDPGDTAKVTLPVTNRGDGTANSTSVVLTSPTPGVTVAPRSKSYGAISPGQTGVNDFTITVPTTQEPGVPVVLNARVTFAGSFSPSTSTFSLPVGTPSPVTRNFVYAGDAVAIPDSDPTGVTVPITVSGVGRASKLTFSVDGATCNTDQTSTTVGINHSYAGDLVGTLTSPSGAKATVFQRGGGSGNNLCQVVFADTAAALFSSAPAGDAPFSGTYKPVQPLGGLTTGTAADGTWKFTAVDVAGGDTGSIRSISLHVNGFVQPGVAERPASVGKSVGRGPVKPV
ncbi:neuroendocrine convertase 1 [Amycolatopsis coloradensis]|uniref:Neuroendocrine convertase 1 n=1 Tax=Amycolatopsis coloradensis TaxID=76021 RepID=A0A1R0KIZ5_9PSEU|nr:S8 family serine peptidase [Amycolatopsis coloradensis]OLZ45780.1 neuroendocrine convertase 1 [Amycolatopsis coloradensis]